MTWQRIRDKVQNMKQGWKKGVRCKRKKLQKRQIDRLRLRVKQTNSQIHSWTIYGQFSIYGQTLSIIKTKAPDPLYSVIVYIVGK